MSRLRHASGDRIKYLKGRTISPAPNTLMRSRPPDALIHTTRKIFWRGTQARQSLGPSRD